MTIENESKRPSNGSMKWGGNDSRNNGTMVFVKFQKTVTEWERDNRHAPKYVLRLLEYYIMMEKMRNEVFPG